jgi:hypothetical protein
MWGSPRSGETALWSYVRKYKAMICVSLIRISVARSLTLVAQTLFRTAWRVANRLGSEELTRQLEPRYADLESKLNRVKTDLERATQTQDRRK